MKISPAIKGIITAACMVAVFLISFRLHREPDSRVQYVVYAIYGAGIVWTLLIYRNSAMFTGKFIDVFGYGFKCFVVVTLCMALFYGIFNYMHPEFAEKTAALYKEELLKQKTMLPNKIDEAVITFKKQYTLKLVSAAIFGYLIIGAVITVVVSALLIHRKQ